VTVTELEAAVEDNLNRAGISAVSTRMAGWVQDELRSWSDDAVWPPPKEGRARVGDPHNWTFLTTTYDFSTVVSQDFYNLPTTFLRPIRIWFETTWGERLLYLEYEVAKQMYFGRNDSYPEVYSIVFNEDGTTAPVLWLFPGPLEIWSAHVTHQKKATAVTGGQTNIFTLRWPDGIIAGATARGLRLLRGHEEAAAWMRERNVVLGQAMGSDRKAETEAAMTLGISTVADGHPASPRPILDEGYPTGRMIDPDSYYD